MFPLCLSGVYLLFVVFCITIISKIQLVVY